MNQQKRFYRRLVCVGIVIALLLLLNWMGHPSYLKSTVGKSGSEKVYAPGGILAQFRGHYGLSETKLGEIDPAGSAMKLATFGMRGVAVALLWNRSLECEKKADWESVRTIGEQITSLEPHFITIWDFVGWKLAYNASAQYDDYRERYRWVTNGFEFLQNGTVYNRLSAKLHKATGWTISQKIGVADEKNQYRRLFREDHDFHQRQKDLFWDNFWSHYQHNFSYDERPDNWLFGRVFYLAAERLFEDPTNNGSDLGKETRPVFYCRSRMNLLNYARWMEIDGCGVTKNNTPVFDDVNAAGAWRTAEKAWNEFSEKRITSVIEDPKKPGSYRVTYLNEYKDCVRERDEILKQLEAMLPEGMTIESIVWDRFNNELDDDMRGVLYPLLVSPVSGDNLSRGGSDLAIQIVRDYLDGKHGPVPGWENWEDRLKESLRNICPEDLRAEYDIPVMLRSNEHSSEFAELQPKIEILKARARDLISVDGKKIAEKIEGDNRLKAEDLCDQLDDLRYRGSFSSMYRDMLDCVRHEHDVIIEPLAEAREARELRTLARDKFYAGQQEEANEAFLGSMNGWRKVMELPEHTDVRNMMQYQTAFLDEVDKYTIILDQLERIFPAEYPFEPIVADSEEGDIRTAEEALNYLQNKADNEDWETVYNNIQKLFGFWSHYFQIADYAPLFPTAESRADFTWTMKLFIEASISSKERLAEARSSGLIEGNPLKPQLELLVRSGEPIYAEILRNESELNTGAENETELVERNLELWKELLAKYPFLIYDKNSEFRPQVELFAALCKDRLSKEGEETAIDFPPEGWND